MILPIQITIGHWRIPPNSNHDQSETLNIQEPIQTANLKSFIKQGLFKQRFRVGFRVGFRACFRVRFRVRDGSST